MWPENWTPYILGILAGLFGWGGNWISNKPKREDNNMQRINSIISHYEKMHQNCEERNKKTCEENQRLRDRIRALKKELREKGSENE